MSPAGSTQMVARAIARGLHAGGSNPELLDLKQSEHRERGSDDPGIIGERLLFVGSPVYADRALPPVLAFIENIPPGNGDAAVPFVTWGGVCSGLALWQLGLALVKRGWRLAGGMKILALHSMMWDIPDPLGHLQPGESELAMVSTFSRDILLHEAAGEEGQLPVERLNDHPEKRSTRMKARLDRAWPVAEKWVVTTKCTQCGMCMKACPTSAIHLDPYPQFLPNCINCYNCVRVCPEEAIGTKLDRVRLMERLTLRSMTINEQPLSTIFNPFE